MNQTQPLPEIDRGALTSRRRSGWSPSSDTELKLPGWGQISTARRHRLVAMLGELVRRNRAAEENSHDGGEQGAQERWSEPLGSTRILPRNLERLAIVYVRQSTLQQTQKHQESTQLQYGLVQRALRLGWPKERIVVIDDDLGCSGSSAEGRPGFQRLVAEVGLGHVGIILGVEVSRLARSCRDWHQLLELCALFGTLICDLDGVYDPAQYNDRLVLGLKGTVSEVELHLIKQRMNTGRLHKARRGELGMRVPMGYIRRPSGEIVKDPDEQVQSIIELIFAQFAARGAINGVLQYLADQGVRMPVRCATGANKGELEWHRPISDDAFQSAAQSGVCRCIRLWTETHGSSTEAAR